MTFIDRFLNSITMYRLVLYGLISLAIYTLILSAFGIISYGVLSLLSSLAILLVACYVSNRIFAKLFRAAPNVESVWITALILFFTLAPAATIGEAALIFFAGTIAMASKYYFAIAKKHLFNPAAVALLVMSLAGTGLAAWWIASPATLAVVAILGLLIVRKLRRFDVFFAFLGASIAGTALAAYVSNTAVLSALSTLVTSWPTVFFGTIMLTEPLTMPPSRELRIVFGVMVGLLFTSQFHIGSLYMTPQLALVIGNLYAYLVGSRHKLFLQFKSMTKLAPNIYEFAFAPARALPFAAGQYIEWTLPHAHPDDRGNRRYFTIASSPQDTEVRLGVRIDPDRASTFKKALLALKGGDQLVADSLAGDFTLPDDISRKLAFIAGGIGITPFASMIRHLLATGEQRDITLFYAANAPTDFAYQDLFAQAQARLGLRVVYLSERLTPEAIKRHLPDCTDRHFYLSGPNAMVQNYKQMLRGMSVAPSKIQTDYFPGF